MATDGLIDFEGDYGADYDHLIRIVIAGYELMHEMAVAAARAACPQARELLVVGPAWGEELPLWQQAFPDAFFTLVESSPAMAARCKQRLKALALGERSRLLPCRLEQSRLVKHSFDLVVAQLVLHLLPEGLQGAVAQQMAELVRPGGLLLFSGSASHGDPQLDALLLATWRERLRLQGIDEALIDRFAVARNHGHCFKVPMWACGVAAELPRSFRDRGLPFGGLGIDGLLLPTLGQAVGLLIRTGGCGQVGISGQSGSDYLACYLELQTSNRNV